MLPQNLDRIFDPYFSTKQAGSGLGLASTHSIISKHNGKITVESKLNQGTVFTILLPAARVTEKMIAEKHPGETEPAPVSAARILVMDDDEVILELVGAILEGLGYTVAYAVHGQEALEKYWEAYQTGSTYDAVIVDLTVPGGMGGQTAAQEILKTDPQAKIIVSSGYATDPVMANYEAYGFKGRVAKPYSLTDLQKVVGQVLQG